MCTAWRENFGKDWKRSTASPQEMTGNGSVPTHVWTYQLFRVGEAETKYQLTTIEQAKGVEGTHDSMAYHNERPFSGRPFSTQDHDNDVA